MGNISKDIEVFKIGTHTDSEGETQEWTKEDLETIVKTYNERLAADPGVEAPIVKGHPATDDPALGWVKNLRLEGDVVIAKVEFNSAFADQVKDEQYKKVSIALYPDLMLRHLGFLGAAQPAVKGLEPVKFNRKEKFKTFKFEDPANPNTDSISAFKTAQIERSKQYGIAVKDGIGYVEKPQVYANLSDDQFADPVNYLYPIQDKSNWLASWKMWDMWDNREQYKNIERQIILARFIALAETYGLEIKKEIYFAEFTIALKDSLKRDKPLVWKEYATDDFGDPVHYRFPLKSKSDVKASMAIFSRDNVFKQYEEKEQQYIASRIIRAAQTHEIKLTPGTWAYVEIPAEKLSKNQLLDLVKQTENNNSFTNNESVNMDEYLNALSAYLVQKIAETVNQEIATQLQTWIDEYKTSNPLPTTTDTAATAGTQPAGSTNSEPQIPAQFAEKIANLERKNRELEFNEYFKSQTGRLLPSQKDLLFSLFESTHNQGFEFSENGKTNTSTVQEGLKKFISTLPKQVEFSEQAVKGQTTKSSNFCMPEGSMIDESKLELHNKALTYVDEQQKLGKPVSYFNAFQHVIKNN